MFVETKKKRNWTSECLLVCFRRGCEKQDRFGSFFAAESQQGAKTECKFMFQI